MIDTVVLRFRDHQEGVDTISEHRRLIERFKYVWWGWWRKQSESGRSRELDELQARARRNPLKIGLFDRSTGRYFSAMASDFVANVVSNGAPELEKVPDYYSNSRTIEAWVKLESIKPLTLNQFTETFGEVPTGENTFYPVERGRSSTSKDGPDYYKLSSDYALHISDLHFGADHGFPLKSATGRQTMIRRLKDDIDRLADGRVGMIFVSGDLTTKADANTLLVEGLDFLRSLHGELKVPKEAILVIPGNHDFRLSEYQPTDFSHERPFNLMLEQFYGAYDPNEKIRRFIFPSGHKTEILMINSVRLRKVEESNYGYVEWSMYESKLRKIERDNEATRIAMLHHHLLSMPKEELVEADYKHAGVSTTIDSGHVIEGLQAHGFKLAIHGHQHVPGFAKISRSVIQRENAALPESDLAVLSAGSAGANRLTDSMRDNSYNMLRFDRRQIDIDSRRYNSGMPASRYFSATLSC